MRIDSGQQLLQHIDAGGQVTLARDGGLKTQGAAGRFFQRIGDALRGLSASGRASIAARAERLQGAMAELISRDNALPNLAGGGRPGQPSPLARNALVARMEVTKHLSALPAEARGHTSGVVHAFLNATGKLAGTPAEVRENAAAIIRHLAGKPAMVQALSRMSAQPSAAGLANLRDRMREDCASEFLKPSQQKGVGADGFHEVYLKDAQRGNIRSFNGEPPRPGEWKEQLAELVPNKAMLPFVSFMASQGGVEGALFVLLCQPGTQPSGMPSFMEFMQQGGAGTDLAHHYDISVENGALNIHLSHSLRFDVQDAGLGVKIDGRTETPVSLGTHNYDVTMSIPLDQDMTGKTVPDYTLSVDMHVEA